MTDLPILHVKNLGKADYQPVWQAMKDFTDGRDAHTPDELWLVEHPLYLHRAKRAKPSICWPTGAIPVVATDRGGQVTYHGPYQLVAYPCWIYAA